jgi:hypothetical protein
MRRTTRLIAGNARHLAHAGGAASLDRNSAALSGRPHAW